MHIVEVQYPFAYDENGDLVDVETIEINRRYEHRYSCPECGQEMRPRLRGERARCFYHFKSGPCSLESYIHRVGKVLLRERFYSDDPFIIDFEQNQVCASRGICKDIQETYCPCNGGQKIEKEFDLKR